MGTIREFLLYNAVGIVNTFFGFGLILFLMTVLGLDERASNFYGYFAGALLSYYLNCRYTFGKYGYIAYRALKFFAILLFAYGVNYWVLDSMLEHYSPLLSQIVSAICYTLVSFFLMKLILFRGASK